MRHRALLGLFVLIAHGSLLQAAEPVPVAGRLIKGFDQRIRAPHLASLVDRSPVIFSGTVLSIIHTPNQNWVAVDFNVEAGIRGTVPGHFQARFTTAFLDSFPLRTGERLVVFLHLRNAAGFTSFVLGGCGIYERTGADHVDLRRLQFCPQPSVIPSTSLPEPVTFWPKPESNFPEEAWWTAFSPTPVRNAVQLEEKSDQSLYGDISTAVLLRSLKQLASNSLRSRQDVILDPLLAR